MFHSLAGRRLLPKLPKPLLRRLLGLPERGPTRAERLAAFPTGGLPLERPATVRWNDHLVPYVEAGTDRDLALVLGMVHAHLREAQMEFLKLLAQGRLAEFLGPLAYEVDKALRIVDVGRAVPEMERRMPEETRAWVQAYVDGLNHYWSRVPQRAPEFRLLARGHEPWTVRDVLTVGRMLGADFAWLTYVSLLKRRGKEGFGELWRRVREVGEAAADPFGEGAGPAAIASILGGTGRAGSNSVAVAAHRSASGGAMIASDPHLGLSLPNMWLIAGLRSPSYQVVGLTFPGVPIVGLGRNPDLAWGGTNMRAASTDLYDVSSLDPASFETRRTRIKARFGPTVEREIRRSPFGPVLSDTRLFPAAPGETIAFRWAGHEPTDEITALLRAARARTPQELRESFKGYGVTPLNVVFADREGNIGLLLAVHQPVRSRFSDADLVLDARDPDTHWQGFVGVMELPFTLNPPEGVIASANNRPRDTNIPIGFLFGVESRLRRLYELLNVRERLTFEDLAALQTDTRLPDAQTLAHQLADRIEAAGAAEAGDLVGRLRAWDGDYAESSRGAVAFEVLLAHLVPAVEGETVPAGSLDQQGQWSQILSYLVRDLDALPAARRAELLRAAAAKAAAGMDRFPAWGDMHRLKIAHFLAQVPVIGDALVLGDMPAGGSRATPMKSAHGLVADKHNPSMGSMARHVSDLSDPDANWFVLLGGQDGWFGAENFADQVPLWRERRYIRMPLTPERVREEFPTVLELEPGA
jgi:penicillin G amidase